MFYGLTNRFLVEAIKITIVAKTHFWDLLCDDFYTLVSSNHKLLQEICSTQKYKKSAQEEEPTPFNIG
jgi:hypothetical protein